MSSLLAWFALGWNVEPACLVAHTSSHRRLLEPWLQLLFRSTTRTIKHRPKSLLMVLL